jgi:hypothetical protein
MRSVYGGVAMELVVTQVFGWVGWGRAGWWWVGGVWFWVMSRDCSTGVSAFVGGGIEVTKGFLESFGRMGEG